MAGTDYTFVRWTRSGADQPDGQATLAFDINDNGQIAGLNNFHYRAWRFTPGVGYENLGSGYKGKYNNSSGHAINNNGDVACESSGGSSIRKGCGS